MVLPMFTLISILLVISVIVLWVYLAKKHKADIRSTSPPSGSKYAAVVVGVFLSMVLLPRLISHIENTYNLDIPLPKIEKKENVETKSVQDAPNLGITYEKFKTRYSALLKKHALPENLNLMSEKYDEKTCTYQSSINGRAVMECTVEPKTGYLKRIAVSARPFIIDDKETKVELLLIQSTTFSMAVAVVNPAMEDMSYREDVIKNLYSNVHTTEYRMVGNLKCKADRRGEEITLSAVPVS